MIQPTDRKFLLFCLAVSARKRCPQAHAIAIKEDGEVLAQKQQYRNHQGKTAMQFN